MTITAQSIIIQAHDLLQDAAGDRWPATELVAHLNDGQRALVALRPEEFSVTASHALVAGSKQAAPSNCASLLEIPRNTNGSAIRPVERVILDSFVPGWYSATGSTVVQHTMHDAREPNTFYVYPPATIGASVELVYAAWPADVSTPGGPTASSVTGNINCNNKFKSSLLHFVVARALLKDSEFAGNAALAASHMQLFNSSAGVVAPAIASKD